MKSEIIKLVFTLGEYYDKRLTPEQLEMYSQDLSVLSPEELRDAILKYRADGRNDRFPLPAKLISIIRPVETELDLGNDVASRIIGAVSRFGSYRGAEARAYIGEIGWECVKRFGGWVTICSELTDDTKTSIFAQLRGLAQTVAKKGANGTLEVAPDFKKEIGTEQVRALIAGFSSKGSD
jgi:hypothetical protein